MNIEISSYRTAIRYLIVYVAAALTLTLGASTSQALPAEHEAERLLIATEQAFDNNQYQQAGTYLEKVRLLGITPPLDYQFFNGKLLLHKKQYTQARYQLEGYVSQSGKEGSHYREALALITEIEGKTSAATRASATSAGTKNKGKVEIAWSEDNSQYVNKLLKIYNTNDPERALTRHINSLLKFYAYSDDRIIAASRMSTPSQHQLFTGHRGEIVSMNKLGAGEDVPFTEDRFSVYGVNPQISYKCFQSSSNCWFYHPVTQQRWLQIVENRNAAEEVSKALSYLIKDMQKSG